MNITIDEIDGGVRAHVAEPRLDAALAIRFKDRLREVVSRHGPLILLDLSEVNFMDSSGLGAILAIPLTLLVKAVLVDTDPAAGWAKGDAFWDEPEVRSLGPSPDVRAQTVARTRWFRLRLDVELDGAQMSEVALIDAGADPARLVSRSWGQD